ncbi:MAG: peptidase M48, partial [Pseudanabaenaceae cyanobacterium bins.68]|nr:peptidase M48 [Pseudanabaenaceae cyanobacterium bins.68]
EWRRKAELSSDRAALLVIDDLDTVIQTMMKISGGSDRYRHELSMAEFIRQSETYQELDRDSLNQIYKFLLYNGFNSGMMLSHPFPVERVHYLQQWAASAQYQQIRQGNYSQQASGVEVKAESDQAQDPTEELRQQIERLQAEINRVKGENS